MSIHTEFQIPVADDTTQKLIGFIDVDATVDLAEGEIEYKTIKYGGADILPLLDNVVAADTLLEFIHSKTLEAAYNKNLKNF